MRFLKSNSKMSKKLILQRRMIVLYEDLKKWKKIMNGKKSEYFTEEELQNTINIQRKNLLKLKEQYKNLLIRRREIFNENNNGKKIDKRYICDKCKEFEWCTKLDEESCDKL